MISSNPCLINDEYLNVFVQDNLGSKEMGDMERKLNFEQKHTKKTFSFIFIMLHSEILSQPNCNAI